MTELKEVQKAWSAAKAELDGVQRVYDALTLDMEISVEEGLPGAGSPADRAVVKRSRLARAKLKPLKTKMDIISKFLDGYELIEEARKLNDQHELTYRF